MTSAAELVRAFRNLRVLVIGDAMLDTYFEGTAARLCSEGPVPVVRKTGEVRVPGGAANTAANVRALGADVQLLSTVGDDPAGTTLRAVLRAHHVDDATLITDPHASTLHKLRIIADGQYVVRFDDETHPTLADRTHAALLRLLEPAYASCDAVLISDYGYGVVTAELIARLVALRARRPRPLVVDSKVLHRFQRAGATLITPNQSEARLFLDGAQAPTFAPGERPDPQDAADLGQRLLAVIDAEHVAITLGNGGVLLNSRSGASEHIAAHPVTQAHDVGAGDSFAAATTLALAAGGDLPTAARIGIDAAGLAVARRFTAIVSHQELLQRVSLREHIAVAGALSGTSVAREVARVQRVLDASRRRGQRIVFTNGVFDILHAGHVQFLRQARALGDLLVVGVNSDASARRLKGPGRPINGELDRLALVTALDAVDHALLFDEETPAALIAALRPNLHIKGGDYAGASLPEAEAVAAAGGQVVILPLVGTLSTSRVIDRIVALAGADRAPATGGPA